MRVLPYFVLLFGWCIVVTPKAAEIRDKGPEAFLSTENRPQWMLEKIDRAARQLAEDESNLWTYNGDSTYGIGGLDEQALALKIIQGALKMENPRKDFYMMDVGCGVFQWGKALQTYLINI